MEAAIEYRLCEKRSNKPRVKQEICQACPEDCEFAGAKPESGRWLKDCEICNVGLCSYIDDLKEKQGLSVKAAAKRMAGEAEGLYSKSAIESRYRYYKHGMKSAWKPRTQNSEPTEPDTQETTEADHTPTTPTTTTKPRESANEEVIIDDSLNLDRIKTAWNMCTKKDRKKFMRWVKEHFLFNLRF